MLYTTFVLPFHIRELWPMGNCAGSTPALLFCMRSFHALVMQCQGVKERRNDWGMSRDKPMDAYQPDSRAALLLPYVSGCQWNGTTVFWHHAKCRSWLHLGHYREKGKNNFLLISTTRPSSALGCHSLLLSLIQMISVSPGLSEIFKLNSRMHPFVSLWFLDMGLEEVISTSG